MAECLVQELGIEKGVSELLAGIHYMRYFAFKQSRIVSYQELLSAIDNMEQFLTQYPRVKLIIVDS